MKRLILSGEEKTLQSVWDWYEYHLRLSLLSKIGLEGKILSGSPDVDGRFFGMSPEELDDFFGELDLMAMLDLFAATEAVIRLDYWSRVDGYKKDGLSRRMCEIYKEKKMRASLEDDLLETWAQLRPERRDAIRDFTAALKYRHWLAHGRYWRQGFARNYSAGDIFDICEGLIKAIAAS